MSTTSWSRCYAKQSDRETSASSTFFSLFISPHVRCNRADSARGSFTPSKEVARPFSSVCGGGPHAFLLLCRACRHQCNFSHLSSSSCSKMSLRCMAPPREMVVPSRKRKRSVGTDGEGEREREREREFDPARGEGRSFDGVLLWNTKRKRKVSQSSPARLEGKNLPSLTRTRTKYEPDRKGVGGEPILMHKQISRIKF